MSATNYFPASRNITIFAISNYDKRKLALRKSLLFREELYQRVQNERNYPKILVDVINEFASLKEKIDMKEEVARRSKTRKKKKKKATARKTRTTNRKKVATMEKKMKKDWKKLKTKTTEKKRKTQQMRNLRLMRARGKIQLAVAGSERRRTYSLCYYAMGSPLVTLGSHRYKFLCCASAFQFYSISLPWLHDDPLTKGHCLPVSSCFGNAQKRYGAVSLDLSIFHQHPYLTSGHWS